MRLIDIESESFLNEMREKQNACKEMIHSSDGETPTWTERDHWEGVYGIFVEMALALKKQPTVDVAPVVHGAWKEDRTDIICTACNERFSDEIVFASLRHWDGEMWMKYCPYCGAKMDLEG
jgi:hypothetical protein